MIEAEQIEVSVAAEREPLGQRSDRLANVVIGDVGRFHARERVESAANRAPGQESDPGKILDGRERDGRLTGAQKLAERRRVGSRQSANLDRDVIRPLSLTMDG